MSDEATSRRITAGFFREHPVSELARPTLGDKVPVPWEESTADHGALRVRIAEVVPGFEDFNDRAARPGGFRLPSPVNEGRIVVRLERTTTGAVGATAPAPRSDGP